MNKIEQIEREIDKLTEIVNKLGNVPTENIPYIINEIVTFGEKENKVELIVMGDSGSDSALLSLDDEFLTIIEDQGNNFYEQSKHMANGNEASLLYKTETFDKKLYEMCKYIQRYLIKHYGDHRSVGIYSDCINFGSYED